MGHWALCCSFLDVHCKVGFWTSRPLVLYAVCFLSFVFPLITFQFKVKATGFVLTSLFSILIAVYSQLIVNNSYSIWFWHSHCEFGWLPILGINILLQHFSSCSSVDIFSTLGRFVQFNWSIPMQKRVFCRLLVRHLLQLEDSEFNVTSGLL